MRTLHIGFIGLGLIGGSIAKAIRRVHPDYKITAYNRSESARIMSINDGTCNFVADKVDNSFYDCDYIFLCTPVEHNISYLSMLKNIISDNCIITDVGSVKGNIHREIIKLDMETNFIGGHPMAGSEKTGYKNSSDRLIENAFYALTKTRLTTDEKYNELTQLIESINAIAVSIDYEEHDRSVAAISHLPHVIASTLVNLVKDSDSSNGYMKLLAAGGFKDITRIASSSPEMWEEICTTNSNNISSFINQYIEALKNIQCKIDRKNNNEINSFFAEGREYRNSFSSTALGPISKEYRIYCDIIDESGAIATIATLLAAQGISIKNIGIIHNREFEEGVLRIEFYNQKALENAVLHLNKYNYVIHTN